MTTLEPEVEQAVAVREEPKALAVDKAAPLTAQQLRTVEIAGVLEPAYQKASTLELSDAEIAAITAPFPDSVVEIRPHDGLIYIPHIHVSDRLNKIIKPGKWALICRRHWLEGTTMYGEYVLLVRGCFVGESVGGHPYQPNNPKTNYSDTLESTAAEALRRICGKRLSCGSQVWDPSYARAWVEKNAYESRGKWYKRRNSDAPPGNTHQNSPQTATAPNLASPAEDDVRYDFDSLPTTKPGAEVTIEHVLATPDQKKKFVDELTPDQARAIHAYFVDIGAIMDTEAIIDVPLAFMPSLRSEWRQLMGAAGTPPPRMRCSWMPKEGSVPSPEAKQEAKKANPAPAPANGETAPEYFWDIIVPVPHRGQKRDEYLKHPDTIKSLFDARHGTDADSQDARQRLWGFVNNYEAKGWTKKDGTQMPASASDIQFRKALDDFQDWFEKFHPDEKL